MERLNTENLNENDSQIGALATPRFTHEAEEHAVPVEKLPEPRTVRGLLGTQISPYWFLGIAIVTTLFLGAVGGAVAGLRDNQQPFESEALGGAVTGETNPDVAAQPAVPVTVTSLEQPETKIRATRRSAGPSFRVPARIVRTDDVDESQQQPVARKVGVLSGPTVFRFERKRRVLVEDN